MKQIIVFLSILLVSNLTVNSYAQSLKEILSSSAVKDAVTSLTGGEKCNICQPGGYLELR